MVRQQTIALLGAVAVLMAVGVLPGGVGASPTASTTDAGHGTQSGNYTVDLPFATDHYPRDENPGGPYNASINHLAAGTPEVFERNGAPEGLEELDFIIISNQDIDFSECTTENTAAFGIDRDDDSPGTETDVGLLSYRENSEFREHSIVIEFYDEGDIAAPSREDKGGKETGREDGDADPEMYPDDEIVAHQGYRSGGGPCYGMPEDPGWYQIEGYLNGTAFNGNEGEITVPSHYFYICQCDSEREAYETLGPPPGQENPYNESDGDPATATATATPEPGDSEEDPEGDSTPTATATPTPTDTPTETSTDSDSMGASTPTATPTPTEASSGDGDGGDGSDGSDGSDGGTGSGTATDTATTGGETGGDGGQQAQQQDQAAPGTTPTAGAGPGFGTLATLAGALLAGLLARRRR